MKITLIGPGIMPIPPLGWGAVEILIWDTKIALESLGHQVQITNTKDYNQIIREIDSFNPDFVHIHYDEFINLYPYIQYPKAITSHYGYLERPELFGGYAYIANEFANLKPNTFCLSEGIQNMYKVLLNLPESNLFLTPNGVNLSQFSLVMIHNIWTDQFILLKLTTEKGSILFKVLKVSGMLVILQMVDLILLKIILVNGIRTHCTMI